MATLLTVTMDDDPSPAWIRAEQAVPAGAQRLAAIEQVIDAALHSVFLDVETATVYHAYASPEDSGVWHLDAEPASEAIEWLEEQCHQCTDALDDPAEHYQYGHRTPDDDFEVLDELNAVRLSALKSAASAGIAELESIGAAEGLDVFTLVDRELVHRIHQAEKLRARLAGLRAAHIRAAFEGGGVGWQSRAAERLGVSRSAVAKMLDADVKRRAKILNVAATPSRPIEDVV